MAPANNGKEEPRIHLQDEHQAMQGRKNMFAFKRVVFLVLALCSLAVLVAAADAQQVTYYYTYPQPQLGSFHYDRYYQGNYLAWSPSSGWYQYQSYIDVPHWTPAPTYVEPYWIARW